MYAPLSLSLGASAPLQLCRYVRREKPPLRIIVSSLSKVGSRPVRAGNCSGQNELNFAHRARASNVDSAQADNKLITRPIL